MALAVPTKVNSFSPTSTSPSSDSWNNYNAVSEYQKAYGELKSGLGGASQAVDDFLRANGGSNPPFSTSTAGRLTPNQGGNLRITRGYIRRSAPDSGDSMSQASLNFMYNPTEIVRDYVSYLDQAALDPFNTVYNSGNLVTAPSFVNFSFTLLFDRQIEAMETGNKGVLADYKYFDMVVRNIPPSSGSSGIPDNGIMMANPKDITVVFSRELTVQGRPTNARVQFIKFNREMIPTRMIVSLTMIITYFGPIRQAYGFDTFQSTGDYEALVPYSQIYSETYTSQELETAIKSYSESQRILSEQDAATPRLSPYRVGVGGTGGALGQVTGAAGVSVPANSALAAKTLSVAKQLSNRPGQFYSQASRRGPNSYDCSGFISVVYETCGAGDALPSGNTDSIYAANSKAGWKRKMALVAEGRSNLNDAFKRNAQPGDLILRIGTSRSNHLMMFDGWDGDRMKVVHATSYPEPQGTIGNDTVSASQVATYTHLMRPAAAGGSGSIASVSPLFGTGGVV